MFWEKLIIFINQERNIQFQAQYQSLIYFGQLSEDIGFYQAKLVLKTAVLINQRTSQFQFQIYNTNQLSFCIFYEKKSWPSVSLHSHKFPDSSGIYILSYTISGIFLLDIVKFHICHFLLKLIEEMLINLDTS